MAGPPPIRRQTTKPPPIPRVPITPRTDLTQSSDTTGELPEDTRNLEAPDAGQLVEHMLDLVASEAGALLAGDDSDGRLADLNVRTAFASWDGLRAPDDAMRYLELAEHHPLAPRLRLAAAIAQDAAALAAAQPHVETAPILALDLAEAWLFRFARPELAAEIAERIPEGPLRGAAIELAALAHAAAGAWERVIELRRGSISDTTPPDEVAATAALILDRTDDAAGALALCWPAVERLETPAADSDTAMTSVPASRGSALRLVDVALDAAAHAGDPRKLELLERRVELLAALPGGALETFATRHALAAELTRAGRHGDAEALWAQLADDPVAAHPSGGRRIATLAGAWAAIAAGDHVAALAAHRRLADSDCAEIAASHTWRALDLALVLGDPGVDDLSRAVVDASDSLVAERSLDALEVKTPTAATLTRFEARGGLALRWAAAIAERLGYPTRALGLWRRVAAEAPLGTEHDHLIRLLRSGSIVGDTGEVTSEPDLNALADEYVAWVRAETDPRCTAALQCARGIVDLVRGDFVQAEESLLRAADLGPGDPFCRAALAAVYRAGKHYDQLAQVLAELSTSLVSPDARAAAAREYAELLDEHLGDPAGARAALERMIAERPEDDDAMLALAKLYDRDQDWTRSIDLRKRAVSLAATPEERAELWLEISTREESRGDRDAALGALDRAAESAPGRDDVIREKRRVYREAGRHTEALELVRAELATDPPTARRMQLLAEQAQLLTALDREPATVVAIYLEMLDIEPAHAEALAGIEPTARKLGLWDELARAFRGATQTPRNLEVLAEALTKISEWSELAEVRRKQLEAATSPIEKAQRASELAHLYENELGDAEAAIRMLTIAHGAVTDEATLRDLMRLLRAAQHWPELAALLEREIPKQPPSEPHRAVNLLLELGEIRGEQLKRPGEAALAYEGVMEREPSNPLAAERLEKLYEQLGKDRELAVLLEARADATADKPARGALLARVASLRSNRGDIDGAIAAYAASFGADPTNRDVFTTMERVAYKAESWAAAMELYDMAIAHVEAGGSRAYRLGDLYLRRGNVQLNFLGQAEDAIASYQKVVEVDPQPTSALQALDDLCKSRGDWAPLVAAWERRAETQRDPQRRADALRTAAALSAEHLGDQRSSMQLNRKLLAIDPNDLEAAEALERYYLEHQDTSGLIEVLKMRLHNAAPEDTIALHKRIARVSEEGARDVDTATEHYLKILELDPDNRDALEALGRIYESTEQWAELIDITRRQIRVTHDRNVKALLYFKCGSVMEAKFGREHDAIRYYDAAIKTSAACLPAVHGLRDLYRRREEWPRVIETLELEVKLWNDDKERAGVFAQIGRIHENQLGDPERAMHFYESALSVDPDCLPANQALFDHFFEQGAWDKAMPIASALAQKAMRDGDPATRSEFYRKRGVVARVTGDPKAAADSFVVALEIKPTNTAALDDLGALAHEAPEVWDFDATYRELEKVYKRRDDANALLARVQIGLAASVERAGDLDAAAELYRAALELAPTDLTILSALVDFHADTRHWALAIAAIQRFVEGGAGPADRLAALMRQAELHADGEMDVNRAIAVLRHVIQLEPSHQDAYYLLAQQWFLMGRFAEARAAIDRVIELATAPGQPLIPEALARYYYYKGRILDASGDARSAAPQYHRAIDYDPGYAPPALVLARRASEAGDQRQAETLLIETAHAAMAQGGPRAAVPLQRGLARMLLASGDRPAAIEAYRGILNIEPEGASDRVALAEIYAVDDPQRAIGELRKVLDRDIHHAPGYRLLASFYNRTGDVERAHRVLTALDLLGFAEEADRQAMHRLRAARQMPQLRRGLDESNRERLLLTIAAREPLGEVWNALAEEVNAFVAQPALGENLVPAEGVGDPRLIEIANEVGALYDVEVDVFVGDRVPALFAATAFPRRLLVIDRTLLGETDLTLRFLFGYAFEAIRGNYAALLQLGARERRELAQLLRGLVSDGEATGPAAEIIATAPESAAQLLERHAGTRDVDPGMWIDGMLACAKRAGLVACDDFGAAIWMVARLAGEKLESHDETVALGAVLGGPDLVRFYLSDNYQLIRDLLALPA